MQYIHKWRIDIRSLTLSTGEKNDGGEFQRLIHELENKYQEWPKIQKEDAQERIS